MLPLGYKQYFQKFLLAVDKFVSREVDHSKGNVGEVPSTKRFLSALDEGRVPPDGLEYNVRSLKQDCELLKIEGFDGYPVVNFNFEEFSQQYEGAVTQADYAMTLKFVDTSDTATGQDDWEITYLLQAKVARPNNTNTTQPNWDSASYFAPTANQCGKIITLRELIGDRIFYNLYGPVGMAKYVNQEYWNETNSDSSGIWLSSDLPRTIRDLFLKNPEDIRPWYSFVMDHFFESDISSRKIKRFTQNDSSQDEIDMSRRSDEVLRGIIDRDEESIKRIMDYINPGNLGTIRGFQQRSARYIISLDLYFPKIDYEYFLDHQGPDNDVQPDSPRPSGRF